jgi:hypothetical protein
MSFLDEIDTEIREAGLDRAIALCETPPVFDWLLAAFSFQGISDQAARSYMEMHGTAFWAAIEAINRIGDALPSIPKPNFRPNRRRVRRN